MPLALTTTDLLSEVRRVGMFPATSANALGDTDLLAHANRAMRASLVPLLMRVQEEYFVRRVSQTLTAGQAAYPVPRRAVGSRVRDVIYVRGGIRSPLPRLRPEQVTDFITSATGQPFGFYLDAANIILLPAPSAADSLEIAIYVRPGTLVDAATCETITQVQADNPTTGRTKLTFSSGTTFGSTVDVISGASPFEHKELDLSTANVTGTTLDVATSSLLSTPSVGDYVCPPDSSALVQLPPEAFPLLVERTAAYAMKALGYLEEAQSLDESCGRMEQDVVVMLTPRTDGSPRRVTGGLVRLINRSSGWRY